MADIELDDLHREFRDAHPSLIASPFKNGRKHYGKSIDEDSILPTCPTFWAVDNQGALVQVAVYARYAGRMIPRGRLFLGSVEAKAVKRHDSYPPLTKFLTKGVLDRAKLYGHLEACAQKWNVVQG